MSSYSPEWSYSPNCWSFPHHLYFWFCFLHSQFSPYPYLCQSSNRNQIKILSFFFFNETVIPRVKIFLLVFLIQIHILNFCHGFLNHILLSGTIYMQLFPLNKLCLIYIPMNKHLLTHSQLLCMGIFVIILYIFQKVWHSNLHVAVTQ